MHYLRNDIGRHSRVALDTADYIVLSGTQKSNTEGCWSDTRRDRKADPTSVFD
jgi:hypothetical protein